jgi:5'-deoxynucleotidase YfbR-like HD superfamily hydrolase
MLEALTELQRLKRLERTGWTLRGLPNGTESVASHSFGVCVTAMMLADEIKVRGQQVDCERVLRMALIHDWAETRIGDTPKTANQYFDAGARKRAESLAFADIVKGVGSSGPDYETLHEDYEQRASLEARIVKAADIVDLLVQAYALERAGARGLDEFWEVANNTDFGLPEVAAQVVTEVIESLIKARATNR